MNKETEVYCDYCDSECIIMHNGPKINYCPHCGTELNDDDSYEDDDND